jgi:hypothetical protein
MTASPVSNRTVRSIGLIMLILGALALVAGASVYAMVRSEIKAQHITVSADTPFLPGLTAGKVVDGPLDAMAEAAAIQLHSTRDDPSATYATVGEEINEAKAAGDTILAEELTAKRTTLMNASFLRASLFTSVLAFGVCLFIIGFGAVVMATGWCFMSLAKRSRAAGPVRAAAPVTTMPERSFTQTAPA